MARLTAEAARTAAEYLAEAVTSGRTLAPFPPGLAPTTPAEARRVAVLLHGMLGLPTVGVRLVSLPPGLGSTPVAGPVFAPRLLHAPAATPPLNRPSPTAALVAQLGRPLPARERPWSVREVAARVGTLHVAIDLGASRFTAGAPDLPCFMADLAGHGAVVLGRAARSGWREAILTPRAARATAADGTVAWRGSVDAAAALRQAAEAARSIGALPEGAVLVAAGLSPVLPEGPLTLAIAGLGKAELTA
jgi:hypothetical protein